MARVAALLGARLVGEDSESYAIRDGLVEQINGSTAYEFGKLGEILAAGPTHGVSRPSDPVRGTCA